MATLTQPAASTQYIQVQVTVIKDGAAYDPTGDKVEMAFLPVTVPATPSTAAVWLPASWEPGPNGTWWAQCLTGPAGGAALLPGQYQALVRVTDDPEVPVLPGPLLVITP